MKSIHSKFVILILLGILISSTIVGGVGIVSLKKTIYKDSITIINLECSKNAQELNNIFGKIEKAANIMAVYTTDSLESVQRLSEDEEYLNEYTKKLGALGDTIAKDIEGAVGIYLRFDPEHTTPTAGYWCIYNTLSETFENHVVTDLSQYNENDTKVAWYYYPKKTGKSVWMNPYINDMNVCVVSYVVPMYKDGVFIGIVGMDIEFDYIAKKCDNIGIYDTGYAFVTDDTYNVLHAKGYSDNEGLEELSHSISLENRKEKISENELYEYELKGVDCQAAFSKLQNGMYLAVTAPVSEITKIGSQHIFRLVMVEFIIISIFIYIAWLIARTIVEPIKSLDLAAKEIAAGNLDVEFDCKSKDEIGTLSKSLKETANQLKIRIDYINNLAYIDTLTGNKNNTSYMNEAMRLTEEMKNTQTQFGLYVIDINGLKEVNDMHGHECGNELIQEAAKCITEVFGYDNIYRIGGDEFVAIMSDLETAKCDEYEKKFIDSIEKYQCQFKMYAAIGSATSEEDNIVSFEDVFRIADERMYRMKTKMKSMGKNSCLA